MGQKRITNKHNLPETLFKAVAYDTHKQSGAVSVTQLIDGPMIRYLKNKHDWETDVADNLYALMGTALHHIIERANIDSVHHQALITTAEYLMSVADKVTDPKQKDQADGLKKVANYLFQLLPVLFPDLEDRFIFERQMQMTFGEYTVSGTFDLYEKELALLDDYKFCGVYQYLNPASRKKWEEQTNIYAYFIRKTLMLPVNRIRIIAFFRDWNAYGHLKNKEYPARQIMEIEVPLMTDLEIENLIEGHLMGHRAADQGNPPPCDGATRWAESDVFAIKASPDAKRAAALFDNRGSAEDYIKNFGHKHPAPYIEKRPGVSVRCEKYCPVAKFCPQYAQELRDKAL